MAFLLENAFNGSSLIADANNHPTVRLFTSKKTSSKVPLLEQTEVEEKWAVSSANATSDDGCPHCPNNTFPPTPGAAMAADWAGFGAGERVQDHMGDDNWLYMSAVCYIFGKNIHAHTGKPVGLMNTNWGGTPVEFCTSLCVRFTHISPGSPGEAGEADIVCSGARQGCRTRRRQRVRRTSLRARRGRGMAAHTTE